MFWVMLHVRHELKTEEHPIKRAKRGKKGLGKRTRREVRATVRHLRCQRRAARECGSD